MVSTRLGRVHTGRLESLPRHSGRVRAHAAPSRAQAATPAQSDAQSGNQDENKTHSDPGSEAEAEVAQHDNEETVPNSPNSTESVLSDPPADIALNLPSPRADGRGPQPVTEVDANPSIPAGPPSFASDHASSLALVSGDQVDLGPDRDTICNRVRRDRTQILRKWQLPSWERVYELPDDDADFDDYHGTELAFAPKRQSERQSRLIWKIVNTWDIGIRDFQRIAARQIWTLPEHRHQKRRVRTDILEKICETLQLVNAPQRKTRTATANHKRQYGADIVKDQASRYLRNARPLERAEEQAEANADHGTHSSLQMKSSQRVGLDSASPGDACLTPQETLLEQRVLEDMQQAPLRPAERVSQYVNGVSTGSAQPCSSENPPAKHLHDEREQRSMGPVDRSRSIQPRPELQRPHASPRLQQKQANEAHHSPVLVDNRTHARFELMADVQTTRASTGHSPIESHAQSSSDNAPSPTLQPPHQSPSRSYSQAVRVSNGSPGNVSAQQFLPPKRPIRDPSHGQQQGTQTPNQGLQNGVLNHSTHQADRVRQSTYPVQMPARVTSTPDRNLQDASGERPAQQPEHPRQPTRAPQAPVRGSHNGTLECLSQGVANHLQQGQMTGSSHQSSAFRPEELSARPELSSATLATPLAAPKNPDNTSPAITPLQRPLPRLISTIKPSAQKRKLMRRRLETDIEILGEDIAGLQSHISSEESELAELRERIKAKQGSVSQAQRELKQCDAYMADLKAELRAQSDDMETEEGSNKRRRLA